MKKSLILSLLLSCQVLLAGESYPLKSIQVEDGLSQNMVYCILQDSNDFIWFGTQDGLNRYDGSFKVFANDPSTGLENDAICSLAEDAHGNIWAGTLEGLFIYDPHREHFSSADAPPALVRDIVRCGDDMWVAVADTLLLRYAAGSPAPDTFLPVKGVGEAQIRSLCTDVDCNIWIAAYKAGLLRISSRTGKAEAFRNPGSDNNYSCVTVLDSKTLLVGTVSEGIYTFDVRSHRFAPFSADVNFVHDITLDRDGRIWAGAEDGLHIWDKAGRTHLVHRQDDPYSISDNAVYCITCDREGGVWIGTYFGGVNYYSDYAARFSKYYPIPDSNGLSGKNISEFCEAPDGTLWIGTEDRGLHSFNPEGGTFRSGYLPADNVHAIEYLDGRLWVGSYGDGLFILDPATGRYKHYMGDGIPDALHENNIYSIFRDTAGEIWIGTESGLYLYDKQKDVVSRVFEEQMAGVQVNDIYEDVDGRLWFASFGRGAFCLARPGEVPRSVPIGSEGESGSTYLTCILEDMDRNLWFGTSDAGTYMYNHLTDKVEKHWSQADGLPNNMVYMLLEDRKGNIWGSTNHGIFCIARSGGGVSAFNHESGLVCDQFNFKSGIVSRDGRMYFGGVKGFVSFDPEQVLQPEGKAKIVFNRFLQPNAEVAIGAKGSPLEESILYTRELTLPRSRSIFSIGFADLGYAMSGTRTYQYRLEGRDREWTDIEGRMISYSGISPGSYKLQVRDATLSGNTAEIAIDILPPFYLSTWAISLYVLLLAALIWFGFKKVKEREKMRNLATLALSRTDREFLDKLTECIYSRMENPDMDVNDIAEALNMSRATLYRRMKTVTDLPPGDFIKLCRLKKAAQLLGEGGRPVSEVATAVGFSSTSYFSKCFTAQFGVSPKDYLRS